MTKKRGRPPKSPSSSQSQKQPDAMHNEINPHVFDLTKLDEEDLALIDNLSAKQLESLVQGIELIRARVKGKSPVEPTKDSNGENNARDAEPSEKMLKRK
ncbi:hypothetical protein RIF29_19139 [Crotalaria pallida]|uniref:Uncharacterized protein n=1 Tax=Crotalaria pallida TaxID=3830 RepID=A0AAN9F192_CROPI